MDVEQRIFGFSDPHPNTWKVRVLSKAVLLASLGKLTPAVIQELQAEYGQWQADKAVEKGVLKDG